MKKFSDFGVKLVKHPLFSGSFVMMVGSNLTNLLAYVYHFIIGRMLGPANYSELSSLLGVLTILFTALTFLGTIVVKFVSSDNSSTSQVFRWFAKKVNILVIFVVLVVSLSVPAISHYLKINTTSAYLLVPLAGLGILGTLYKSFVQGKLKFKEFAIAINIDLFVRLVISILAVYFGFRVFGAFTGYVIGTLTSVIFLKIVVDKNLDKKTSEKPIVDLKKIILFSVPVFATSLATNSLLSTDVIMVKHYLNPLDAGIYASLSTLGRVIYYGAAPIGAVMFPIISSKYSQGKKYLRYFILSLLLTVFVCLTVVVGYLLLPRIAIGVLYGPKFIEGANYLFLFGIFNALFTLSALFISFFLSIEKTKITYFSLLAALIQIVGINLFHEKISQVVGVSIFAASLLLLIMIIYFLYEKAAKRI